jgi:hypothetical protein
MVPKSDVFSVVLVSWDRHYLTGLHIHLLVTVAAAAVEVVGQNLLKTSQKNIHI